ncbi:LytTR family DNA-binding domain-containing protein [Chryseobacterium pennipullorum]|uniref:HTH LytTR-type domain-containing protein n=1 Tax=Chryseobacterium pennipullorum TaxID=2258963 RepID=A0A3D9B732_9FLAO|nr:LytTR family DNA-binding domain-containing protein [Chryseobacterium pennipullorum]REC49056.1 hypothetical protein DRF67_05755 [Chryseobacterium pennipullorum]
MFSFTAYSYPKSESLKETLASSTVAGLLVYVFLIVFQPFGTESFQHPYKYLILFPYSVFFGASFFILNLGVLKLSNWNIGLELLKILTVLIVGSVISYFYNTLYISHVDLSLGNYFYMLLYSLAIGIPVSAIYILSRYIYLKKVHESTAQTISGQLTHKKPANDHQLLNISSNTTHLSISENHFLCAQSMENYCILYFTDNGETKKMMLRISLSSLLKQIETPSIRKCHRSFIVNLDHVKNLKGNAQGYKLSIPEMTFEIPVSRSFISFIIPQLKQQVQ